MTANDTSGPADVAVRARPLVLVRAREGTGGQRGRAVHLVPLPEGGRGVVSALCGMLISPQRYETVTPGRGTACERCRASSLVTGLSDGDAGELALPVPDLQGPVLGPREAALRYRNWGWPVILRRDQLWLGLGVDVMAVLVPTGVARQVTAVLEAHHRTPPVLWHPAAPEHHVLLCRERHDMTPRWPVGVHPVTGPVLLPPTQTPRGPVTWIVAPEPQSLHVCRATDVHAALRTATHEQPPAGGPVCF